MWKSVKRIERRSWTTSRKFGRLGVTGAFAIAALLVILIAGWIIDQRGASEADQRLAAFARSARTRPIDLVSAAARSNRVVFLADIHNSTSAKQFAARAITSIAATSGLDAVVLEVGSDQQPYIDLYFDREPEDASTLLSHPRALREPGAASRAYLDIYRAIWKINEKRGPAERIRVIAADLPGWPLARAGSPTETASDMARRAEHMTGIVNTQILNTIPTARVLVFMTGFNVLKSATLTVQTGGATPVRITPFAAHLATTTDEAYSILVDAPVTGTAGREVVPYLGTRAWEILREQDVRKDFATAITSEFDYLKRPLIEKKSPGIDFGIEPGDYKLRDVADAYVNLGS